MIPPYLDSSPSAAGTTVLGLSVWPSRGTHPGLFSKRGWQRASEWSEDEVELRGVKLYARSFSADQ